DNGGTGNEFLQAGNSFGTPAILGTNDNQPLHFETNGSNRMTILTDGKVGIGTESPGSNFEVVGAPNQKFWVDQSSSSSTRAISYGSIEGILLATASPTAATSAWLYD